MSPFVVDPQQGSAFDSIVDRLTAQFGVENRPTIVAVVNEKVREMLVASEWRGSTPVLGTTATGQTQWPLSDASVESVRMLRVGLVQYSRVNTQTLWDLQDVNSGVGLQGPGGVFALTWDDAGNQLVELYPEPEAGLSIEVLDFSIAADSSYGDGSNLPIPKDLNGKLLAGCRAYLYREVDERPDLAPPEQQDFDDGLAALRARKLRRVGGGPQKMRVGVGGRY